MANKLKEEREKHGFTQAELAEKSGISRVTICNLENNAGKNVTAKTLTKLAEALGATVQEIFFQNGV